MNKETVVALSSDGLWFVTELNVDDDGLHYFSSKFMKTHPKCYGHHNIDTVSCYESLIALTVALMRKRSTPQTAAFIERMLHAMRRESIGLEIMRKIVKELIK